MRTFTWLQQLNLTDEQWEDILPEPIIPKLMALVHEACWDGCIAHVFHRKCITKLWVDEQLKFIMSEVLLMLCTEVEAAPVGCQDYNICLEEETSNPMASYGHAFHYKCIPKWFDWRSTCLMCR
ncbi:uncharacterized protein [Miscanthus floridulus]|uniref:uncharacterized protein n=1 Tax=Miscanthus floridulus TaxID=154761 RepID=UPI003458C0B8